MGGPIDIEQKGVIHDHDRDQWWPGDFRCRRAINSSSYFKDHTFKQIIVLYILIISFHTTLRLISLGLFHGKSILSHVIGLSELKQMYFLKSAMMGVNWVKSPVSNSSISFGTAELMFYVIS